MTRPAKKFKVAIVGAGPAGYFTAQAFQKAQSEGLSFSIDMIERLPTPWGLVRSGVAPDHQKIKQVSSVFEKIAHSDDFRLFANVELGKDVTLKKLREQYDVVVIATGAPDGRKLGIPGEELSNSFTASEFVSWYNSHPDFAKFDPDLSGDTAVIIGVGNVALDIARILSMNTNRLEQTDVSEKALLKLKQSNIKKVIICGRRGPENSNFSALELRNLFQFDEIGIDIDSEQIIDAHLRMSNSSIIDKDLKINVDIMSEFSKKKRTKNKVSVEFKFLVTPIEIKGTNKVEEIAFEINTIENTEIKRTGRIVSFRTGLVITAIGYNSSKLLGLPVKDGKIENISGHIANNVYVVGWAKRGSIGVIGSNKSDSKGVVELILSRLQEPKNKPGIDSLLGSRHRFINKEAWKKINNSEIFLGQIKGKPRVKEIDREALIKMGLDRK